MRARLRWLWWTITSWRRARRQSTRDERPGTDDQWRGFPHPLQRFNEQARQDADERKWEP